MISLARRECNSDFLKFLTRLYFVRPKLTYSCCILSLFEIGMEKKMKIYEGTLKVYLLKDLYNANYREKISALIDKSFTVTEEMKNFHRRREQKGYVFNGFFDKCKKTKDFKYPEGSVYSVRVRSVSEDLMKFFRTNLAKTRTQELQALSFEYRTLPDTVVKTLYSITPAVCKFEDGYWQKSHTVDDILKRIEQNARKKLALLGESVPEDIDFVIGFKKLNEYPIVCEYNRKGDNETDFPKIKLLCDKFELEISPNESSQKLAKAVIGAGMLEMNARGFGYVNVKTV